MARTSKKNKGKENLSKNRKSSKKYSVGIYARLSVDVNERKNESIEMQIEIAKEFVSKQKDMVIFDYYTDIGKTGTNFNREGFERMMGDVRMKKINCIIVKDLSRFGRNHIETGNYIEKILPFLGVRFISVTDNFDSVNVLGQNEILGLNLKNLVNEMYAKDIAVKIKSSKKTKWEQGSYTGGVAPYGYRSEWIGDKKCLFLEKTTADIVKKIFDLFLAGRNIKEIVTWLYEKRIVRPMEYHKTGQIYCPPEGTFQQWSGGTVKMILTNPVYLGCLVQGRTCGKDYMMIDRNDINSKEWLVKENTHEAIISKDVFFEVAKKFGKASMYNNIKSDSKKIPVDEDIFADILYCGDCGSKMKRISAVKVFETDKPIRIYSYNCSKIDRIDEYKCISKKITLNDIQNVVKKAIQQELLLSLISINDIVESNVKGVKEIKKRWETELMELERRICNITKFESEQYLKYHLGEITEGDFKCVKDGNNKKIVTYQNKQTDIIEILEKIDCEMIQINKFLCNLINEREKMELTAEVIRTLINRIEIYSDHRVKVIFAFKRKEIKLV